MKNRCMALLGSVELLITLMLLVFISAGVNADSLRRYVIEDAESRNPQEYYNEKTPILEKSGDRQSQGQFSLYFVTGTTHESGLISKFNWSEEKDLSAIAKSGVINFDLWVNNPEDINDAGAGKKFDVTIGSRSNEKFSVWYIPASLLKPGVWNNVVLRINDGNAIVFGSTINGVPIASSPDASVLNTGVDWTKVNYNRFAIYVSGKPVEGYIDNVYAEVSDVSTIPHNTLILSQTDPDSHLEEALREAKPNVFAPKYDIIPPDVRKDAFFTDDILKWDTANGWKAEFYNCEKENFCLSMDQALRGVKNVKIEMNVKLSDAKVILIPPAPIKIDKDFNMLDFWVYGKYHYGTVINLIFKQKDGNLYKWSGGADYYYGTGQLFCNWNLGHAVLPRIIENGAELVSIELIPPDPGNYLYHIDQLRVLNLKDYLATTPVPKHANIGKPVKMPLDPSGACPKTVEAVNVSATMVDNIGYLKYTTKSGEEITYSYAPKTGTMSDLSVSVKGKSTFKPADGSGPIFEYSDKKYDSTVGESVAKCITQKIDGDALIYKWKYTAPGGETNMTYKFSLNGKTLKVEINSAESNVSTWLFGHASNMVNPKVVEIPFMLNCPNMLCNDGMFTTYYADWYKSNVSIIPYVGSNEIKDKNAWYTYKDPGYNYLPRTDGKRYPFKECFYITTSSNFDDCLFSISNPPSPYKNVISERLFKMTSPTANEGITNSRPMVDLFDKYGMNNVYMLFHAGFWSNRASRGPEPWHSRLKTSIATPGGNQAVVDLFNYMKEKGIYPGVYGGLYFWQPISTIWDYNNVAIKPDGSWTPVWIQSYHMKAWNFPEITNTFYRKMKETFGMQTVYEDGWTTHHLWEANDYDHRMPGSGRYIDSLNAIAMGYRNERNVIKGPIFSEGNGSSFYTAGLNDGDYSKLDGFANGKSADKKRTSLLVDFELKKVAPLHAPVGIDITYYVYAGTDLDASDGYKFIYHYWGTQIAFGTIGMIDPYWPPVPDTTKRFDVTLTSYFMMQQLQKRYVMEKIADIQYFDGQKLVNTSQAVINDIYKDNMVCIRYKNGLIIYVNCNWDNKNWIIEDNGKKFNLPPGGWYAKQGKDFVEYSAMVDGRRVDFVDSPEYTYINANGKQINLVGLTTNKILVSHKSGKHKGKIISFPE